MPQTQPEGGAPGREARRGVIVIHPFGAFHEAQFLEDPVVIERLIADGQSWRIKDAVLLTRGSR